MNNMPSYLQWIVLAYYISLISSYNSLMLDNSVGLFKKSFKGREERFIDKNNEVQRRKRGTSQQDQSLEPVTNPQSRSENKTSISIKLLEDVLSKCRQTPKKALCQENYKPKKYILDLNNSPESNFDQSNSLKEKPRSLEDPSKITEVANLGDSKSKEPGGNSDENNFEYPKISVDQNLMSGIINDPSVEDILFIRKDVQDGDEDRSLMDKCNTAAKQLHILKKLQAIYDDIQQRNNRNLNRNLFTPTGPDPKDPSDRQIPAISTNDVANFEPTAAEGLSSPSDPDSIFGSTQDFSPQSSQSEATDATSETTDVTSEFTDVTSERSFLNSGDMNSSPSLSSDPSESTSEIPSESTFSSTVDNFETEQSEDTSESSDLNDFIRKLINSTPISSDESSSPTDYSDTTIGFDPSSTEFTTNPQTTDQSGSDKSLNSDQFTTSSIGSSDPESVENSEPTSSSPLSTESLSSSSEPTFEGGPASPSEPMNRLLPDLSTTDPESPSSEVSTESESTPSESSFSEITTENSNLKFQEESNSPSSEGEGISELSPWSEYSTSPFSSTDPSEETTPFSTAEDADGESSPDTKSLNVNLFESSTVETSESTESVTPDPEFLPVGSSSDLSSTESESSNSDLTTERSVSDPDTRVSDPDQFSSFSASFSTEELTFESSTISSLGNDLEKKFSTDPIETTFSSILPVLFSSVKTSTEGQTGLTDPDEASTDQNFSDSAQESDRNITPADITNPEIPEKHIINKITKVKFEEKVNETVISDVSKTGENDAVKPADPPSQNPEIPPLSVADLKKPIVSPFSTTNKPGITQPGNRTPSKKETQDPKKPIVSPIITTNKPGKTQAGSKSPEKKDVQDPKKPIVSPISSTSKPEVTQAGSKSPDKKEIQEPKKPIVSPIQSGNKTPDRKETQSPKKPTVSPIGTISKPGITQAGSKSPNKKETLDPSMKFPELPKINMSSLENKFTTLNELKTYIKQQSKKTTPKPNGQKPVDPNSSYLNIKDKINEAFHHAEVNLPMDIGTSDLNKTNDKIHIHVSMDDLNKIETANNFNTTKLKPNLKINQKELKNKIELKVPNAIVADGLLDTFFIILLSKNQTKLDLENKNEELGIEVDDMCVPLYENGTVNDFLSINKLLKGNIYFKNSKTKVPIQIKRAGNRQCSSLNKYNIFTNIGEGSFGSNTSRSPINPANQKDQKPKSSDSDGKYPDKPSKKDDGVISIAPLDKTPLDTLNPEDKNFLREHFLKLKNRINAEFDSFIQNPVQQYNKPNSNVKNKR